MNRAHRGISWLIALAILATPSISRALTVQFTDWTSASTLANTASGNLGGVTVTLSGGDLVAAFLSQQITAFTSPIHTPPLATSDALEIVGNTGSPTYVISFNRFVLNPVIHLRSLASTLDFGSASVVKLSGESTFTVSGSIVSGITDDNPNGHDANGTIQLLGQFTSIPFSATYNPTDGFDFQVGAVVPVVPGLSPAFLFVLAATLGLLGMISVHTAQRRSA